MVAVDAEVASTVPYSIFRAFGPLAHDMPINAAPATVQSIWTVIDEQGGYDIPAGTPVGLTLSTNVTMDPVGFATVDDAVVPAGQQTVSIMLMATIPGANSSGLDTVTRADSLMYVTGVTLVGTSQGGTDAELDDDYVNRLSSDFELWTTTPIRGPDFARKARDIAGVYRCAFWENYNPATGTSNNDKYVTLCPIDINGNDVSASVQQQVSAYMQSLREVNFVCPVIGATRSTINVSANLHVPDPSMESQAISDGIAALQQLLNPATWGALTSVTGLYPVWTNTPVLRINQIISALDNVTNVSYSDQVQDAIAGNALSNVDITLPGTFPLPVAGTITLTATSP